MTLPISVLVPFVLSLLARQIQQLSPRFSTVLFVSVPLSLFVYFLANLELVSAGHAIRFFIPWVPELQVNLSLSLDGLSLLFLLLITGIGALVAHYSKGYLGHHSRLGEFYAYIFLFMGSMIGLVLSSNLLLLFCFWELTSFSSFLLIGFNHDKSESRTAALQALLVTMGGGLSLLAGFILLGQIGGSFEIQELIARKDLILANPLSEASLVLILLGALTKSAQVPFHFWLPNAMAAPTPVSAYLHSATMVKAGVYLIARFSHLFSGTALWSDVLLPVGILTAVSGSVLAIKQTDLKKLLAYSTVSSLGMLVVLLGLGTEEAVAAAMVYLFVHSLYKGCLFMVAGAIDHETGSRDVLGLSGLVKVMPLTGFAAALAALSMAGFPPLFGFIGKELLYQAKVDSPDVGWVFYLLSMASNMMTVAIAFIVGVEPFLGKKLISPRPPSEAPVALLLGPVVLSFLGVLFALSPSNLAQPLLSAAASNVSRTQQWVDLKFWHGFNLVFVFSLVTLLGGLLIFFQRNWFRKWIEDLPPVTRYGPEKVYFGALSFLGFFSVWQTRLLQSGYLSRYVLKSLLAVSLLLISVFWFEMPEDFHLQGSEMTWGQVALLTLVVVAAMTATVNSSHILMAACMGIIGFGLAVFYALFSAPDVATTQVLIETLSVVLVVFLISKLGFFSPPQISHSQLIKAAVAGLFGLLMAVLAQVGIQEQKSRGAISMFFNENSLSQAQGRNVVNVILVDFRALDTFGEVTVLAMAAIGVFAILNLYRERRNWRKR